MANSNKAVDTISLSSTASAISTCPDRHGFYGGAQFTEKSREDNLSRDQIIAREKKWLYMIANWKDYMSKNFKKIRERCRKGIPASVRSKAWFYLSGANLLYEKHENLYKELLKRPGNPTVIEDIKKDLHRQFPLHEMFISEEKPGQQELFNILKAYSILNPKVGFCQAQAPIAAFLITQLPTEQAFWCFVSVCDKYLIGYYTPGLEMLQRDAGMLSALLNKTSPTVNKHLEKYKVESLLYMTDWFLCAMTRTLPWDTLLRVWDMFLCEGVKVIFKVALVIIGASLGPQKTRKNNKGLCETLSVLRSPPPYIVEEQFLLHHILRLNITKEDFEIEHEKQAKYHKKIKSL